MTSIERARKLLGRLGETLTDEEVARYRDELAAFADVVFDWWLERRNAPPDSPASGP